MLKRMTVNETVRGAQRDIQKGTREVKRDLASLKHEEQKTISDIKQAKKQGNDRSARILTKSLIRLRAEITKLTASTAQLKKVSTQITTASATHTVGTAMEAASNAMEAVGKVTDAKKVQRSLHTFTRENEKMDIAQEIVLDDFKFSLDLSETKSKSSESKNQDLDETKTAVNSMSDGPPSSPSMKKQSITEKDHIMSVVGILFLAIIAMYVVAEYFVRCFFFV